MPMNEEVQYFMDAEGEFLRGQALADAIKTHTILRFNDVRTIRIDWRPDLRGGDLSIPNDQLPQTGGLEGKLLRDPSEWKPPDADDLWKGQARYANFSKSDLRDANLSALDLSSASFIQSDLRGVRLKGAHVRRADFTGADLEKADLRHTDLFKADFTGANLDGADLSGANLYDAQIEPEALARTLFDEATLLPDGQPYGGEESTWTSKVKALRAKLEKSVHETAPEPAFFSRLWGAIKSWFGS